MFAVSYVFMTCIQHDPNKVMDYAVAKVGKDSGHRAISHLALLLKQK